MIGQLPEPDLEQELQAQLRAIDERCNGEWAAIVRQINRERDEVCIPLMIFNFVAGAACLDHFAAVRDRRREELLARCNAEKQAVIRAYEARSRRRQEIIRRGLYGRPRSPTDLRAVPMPDPRGPLRPGSFTRVGQNMYWR